MPFLEALLDASAAGEGAGGAGSAEDVRSAVRQMREWLFSNPPAALRETAERLRALRGGGASEEAKERSQRVFRLFRLLQLVFAITEEGSTDAGGGEAGGVVLDLLVLATTATVHRRSTAPGAPGSEETGQEEDEEQDQQDQEQKGRAGEEEQAFVASQAVRAFCAVYLDLVDAVLAFSRAPALLTSAQQQCKWLRGQSGTSVQPTRVAVMANGLGLALLLHGYRIPATLTADESGLELELSRHRVLLPMDCRLASSAWSHQWFGWTFSGPEKDLRSQPGAPAAAELTIDVLHTLVAWYSKGTAARAALVAVLRVEIDALCSMCEARSHVASLHLARVETLRDAGIARESDRATLAMRAVLPFCLPAPPMPADPADARRVLLNEVDAVLQSLHRTLTVYEQAFVLDGWETVAREVAVSTTSTHAEQVVKQRVLQALATELQQACLRLGVLGPRLAKLGDVEIMSAAANKAGTTADSGREHQEAPGCWSWVTATRVFSLRAMQYADDTAGKHDRPHLAATEHAGEEAVAATAERTAVEAAALRTRIQRFAVGLLRMALHVATMGNGLEALGPEQVADILQLLDKEVTTTSSAAAASVELLGQLAIAQPHVVMPQIFRCVDSDYRAGQEMQGTSRRSKGAAARMRSMALHVLGSVIVQSAQMMQQQQRQQQMVSTSATGTVQDAAVRMERSRGILSECFERLLGFLTDEDLTHRSQASVLFSALDPMMTFPRLFNHLASVQQDARMAAAGLNALRAALTATTTPNTSTAIEVAAADGGSAFEHRARSFVFILAGLHKDPSDEGKNKIGYDPTAAQPPPAAAASAAHDEGIDGMRAFDRTLAILSSWREDLVASHMWRPLVLAAVQHILDHPEQIAGMRIFSALAAYIANDVHIGAALLEICVRSLHELHGPLRIEPPTIFEQLAPLLVLKRAPWQLWARVVDASAPAQLLALQIGRRACDEDAGNTDRDCHRDDGTGQEHLVELLRIFRERLFNRQEPREVHRLFLEVFSRFPAAVFLPVAAAIFRALLGHCGIPLDLHCGGSASASGNGGQQPHGIEAAENNMVLELDTLTAEQELPTIASASKGVMYIVCQYIAEQGDITAVGTEDARSVFALRCIVTSMLRIMAVPHDLSAPAMADGGGDDGSNRNCAGSADDTLAELQRAIIDTFGFIMYGQLARSAQINLSDKQTVVGSRQWRARQLQESNQRSAGARSATATGHTMRTDSNDEGLLNTTAVRLPFPLPSTSSSAVGGSSAGGDSGRDGRIVGLVPLRTRQLKLGTVGEDAASAADERQPAASVYVPPSKAKPVIEDLGDRDITAARSATAGAAAGFLAPLALMRALLDSACNGQVVVRDGGSQGGPEAPLMWSSAIACVENALSIFFDEGSTTGATMVSIPPALEGFRICCMNVLIMAVTRAQERAKAVHVSSPHRSLLDEITSTVAPAVFRHLQNTVLRTSADNQAPAPPPRVVAACVHVLLTCVYGPGQDGSAQENARSTATSLQSRLGLNVSVPALHELIVNLIQKYEWPPGSANGRPVSRDKDDRQEFATVQLSALKLLMALVATDPTLYASLDISHLQNAALAVGKLHEAEGTHDSVKQLTSILVPMLIPR